MTDPITTPTAGRPTKPCQAPGCDALIVRPTRISSATWEAMKYCDRVCTGRALSAKFTRTYDESRPCAFAECDRIVHRKPGEPPAKWRTHRFCSISCASRSQRRPAKLDTKVCELTECDAVIHRTRKHSDKAWAKVRFCTAAHASASRKVERSAKAKRVATPRARRPTVSSTASPAPVVPTQRQVWRPAAWGGPVTVIEQVRLTG